MSLETSKSKSKNIKTTLAIIHHQSMLTEFIEKRENRAWCKEKGIRISGPPLGRPPKNVSKETKKQAAYDERFRNAIEGKFGQAKRRYSLNCIMAKLPETSETSMAITFLVINLSSLLRQVYCLFMSLFFYPSKLGLRSDYSIDKVNIKAQLFTEKLIF